MTGRTAALLVAPSAIALGFVLLAVRMHVEPPTIPPYTIAPGATTELRPGDQFSLALEPAGILTGAVAAHAFLVQGDHVRPWAPEFLVDRDGTIHVGGAVSTLFAGVPPGEWELTIAIGRPETLPTTATDVLRAHTDGGAAAWMVLRERVWLRG